VGVFEGVGERSSRQAYAVTKSVEHNLAYGVVALFWGKQHRFETVDQNVRGDWDFASHG
jgi:hypothetical protein